MAVLYLHIPFCESKCVYCDFYSVTTRDRTDAFLAALDSEIALRATAVGPVRDAFTSVYLGGGTPSLLTAPEVRGVLDAVRARLPLAADAEISMECNPGTLTREKLEGYRTAGVNRLSIGVQSFDDADLRFLSRIHTADDARDAVARARDAGFDNLNIDLMFALPRQRLDAWKRNLATALELDIPHLSCYALTVEPATPLAAMLRDQPVLAADVEMEAELFEWTMEYLESAGYRHYEVSNYARPGFECRHNLAYWTSEDYLGFGPSAHGTWQSHRYWNASDLARYCAALEADELPLAGGEEVTRDMRAREHLFLALRSTGLDTGEYMDLHGIDLLKERAEILQPLIQLGMITLHNNRFALTRKGFVVCDEICERLMND